MWIAIAVGAAGCFLLKYAGLSVPAPVLADTRVQRVAVLLPVALLAALLVTQTFTEDRAVVLDARAVGLGVALVAVLLRAPFLVVVALAALATAGLRFAL
jgi:hypothetical protein